MCGPIVMNFANSRRALGFYQMGRMFAYVLLGATLGAFGQTLLSTQQSVWISSLSLISIASALLVNGYRVLRGRPLHFPVPAIGTWLSKMTWGRLKLREWPLSLGGFLAGLLTVFLPCGHLYSFLVGAVATGSAIKGAGFMFAFWLGSAPLLSFGSVWFRQALRHRSRKMQRAAGALLVFAGLMSCLTFGARTFEIYQAQAAPVPIENQPPHCH